MPLPKIPAGIKVHMERFETTHTATDERFVATLREDASGRSMRVFGALYESQEDLLTRAIEAFHEENR